MIPKHQTQAFLVGPGNLELRRMPMPEPGPGELLIRVDAATTCGTDVSSAPPPAPRKRRATPW